MIYRIKEEARNLCILAVNCGIMDTDGVILTDGNAASSATRFFEPDEGISRIDTKLIFSRLWIQHDNIWEIKEHKRVMCAEVLMPGKIPYSFIAGAYVLNEEAGCAVKLRGFGKRISINPDLFFSG
jgi:hypothetical protein